MIRFAWGMLLALVAARGADAQRSTSSAAIILELPASARAQGIGGGYVALGTDDAAIFFNPAQLAAATRTSVTLSGQGYLQSSTLAALSGAMRLGPGTAALGIQTLSYGSEDEFVPDTANCNAQCGRATGAEVSAADIVVTAAYAGTFQYGIRFGGAAKLVRQQIADLSGNAVAFDVGLSKQFTFGLTLGAAVQHLGTPLTVASTSAMLPATVRVGAAYPVRFGGSTTLALAVEGTKARGSELLPAGGVELTWTAGNGIALVGRAGLPATAADSDAGRFTAGGGVSASRVALDYSFQQFRTLGGATHRVGVRWWR